MRRRPKPPKGQAKAKRPPARTSPKNDGARVHDLEKQLAEALRLKTEALEQQTATSEILRVISSSPTDAQPVFDTIARSAMRLCDGAFGLVTRYDGELLHLVAHTHVTADGSEALRRMFPMGAGKSGVNERGPLESGVVHLPGMQ